MKLWVCAARMSAVRADSDGRMLVGKVIIYLDNAGVEVELIRPPQPMMPILYIIFSPLLFPASAKCERFADGDYLSASMYFAIAFSVDSLIDSRVEIISTEPVMTDLRLFE